MLHRRGVITLTGPVEEAAADPELWGRLQSCDPDAFRELFGRHSDAIYNYAFRRTASWSLAEDVTQLTFTRLWRQALRGEIEPLRLGSARPLLLVMARNECRNASRSQVRQLRLVDRIGTQASLTSDNVTEGVESEGLIRHIRAAVADLPQDQQDVLELVVWADLSMAEAAEVLSVPIGTVKSRLARARERLHRLGRSSLLEAAR